MKLFLNSPADSRLRFACGILHFEGDIEHSGEPPPQTIFLRIGKRVVKLRRTAQSETQAHFSGRFTMRTGIKHLRFFAQTDSGEQQLWNGLIFYRKAPGKNCRMSSKIPVPAFRKQEHPAPVFSPRIAVILHLYYTDLWPEMAAFISQIQEPFVLYVTVMEKDFSQIASIIQAQFSNAKVIIAENKGRDILPFLQIMQSVPPNHYEYICKIHSKKSTDRWWGDGEFWRRSLLRELLGTPEIIKNILTGFDENPKLGLITAWGQLYNKPIRTDPNVETVKRLAKKMGFEDVSCYRFPAGTMFWVRQQALVPLLKIGLCAEDFQSETGANDGTLAHVVERLFCLSAEKAGFSCEECPEFLPD